MKNIIYSLALIALISCSDLEEKLNDSVSKSEGGSSDVNQLLSGAYGNLRDFLNQDNLLALTQHPTDEMAGPTRGRDWDDAGAWRVLHTHGWTAAHPHVNNVWRTANRNAYNAQQVLCNGATGQVAAEATFLRAFNDFIVLDLFGKIPRRECGENLLNPPSQLLSRIETVPVLISELESVLANLPSSGVTGKGSKNAARALLCKLYLNKAVYLATGTDGGALEPPYNFLSADMDKVIQYANEIQASGYTLDDNYFDNFIPENGTQSSEIIFAIENTSTAAGNIRSRWFMTLHYNQQPSGWNGFVGLTDLYNRFEESDKRKSSDLPYLAQNNSGLKAGFLIGQQKDVNGVDLKDRLGAPLIFTREFSLLETGENLEVTGIRVIKYPPDFDTPGNNADNDYVFLRYADVRLMEAEAILRGGTSSETALGIVNELRQTRGASLRSNIDLAELSNERSRELYWEGWRRNDQIRFGNFLGTWQEKNSPSTSVRLLFPIPSEALSTNPELDQNPGY